MPEETHGNTVRVLITTASLAEAAGGPARTVSALAEHLAGQNVSVEVIASAAPPRYGKPLLPPAELVKTHLLPSMVWPRMRLHWCPRFGRFLEERIRAARPVLVHDQGVWLQNNHAAVAAARRVGVPLITSPRGMLTRWAVQHKAWKKRLAWLFYQGRDLRAARIFHATSEQEANDLRWLGLRQPIAVIPNGISLPPWEEPRTGHEPRTMLFLSRISPKKGLMMLVQAWARARPAGWRCVIAGPDEEGHRAEVESVVRALGLEREFSFPGPVADAAKWELYRTADVFVLPTFTENFGLVVGEALACGIPAITTTGAPWRALTTSGCGWWVDIGVEPIAAALREATAATDSQRREMGLRGRKLVEERFVWPKIAAEMKTVYQWVLGGGAPPGCIYEP